MDGSLYCIVLQWVMRVMVMITHREKMDKFSYQPELYRAAPQNQPVTGTGCTIRLEQRAETKECVNGGTEEGEENGVAFSSIQCQHSYLRELYCENAYYCLTPPECH